MNSQLNSPGKPDLAKVDKAAAGFILDSQICRLPVHPAEVIRRHKWGLVTYSKLSELLQTDLENILEASASQDGYTLFNGNNYCIAYNSAVECVSRISFTLMHEVGHIVLGHFTSTGSSQILFSSDPLKEAEANRFAGDVLAPFAVMDACGYVTQNSLRFECGLSAAAAARRVTEFQVWRPTTADRRILREFEEYIRFVPRLKPDSPIEISREAFPV